MDEPRTATRELQEMRNVFTRIHDANSWRGDQSVSGPGSSLVATALLRPQLLRLFSDLGIQTLADAPCGDVNWITQITGTLDYYFGFDVVESLIARNLAATKQSNHFFRVLDVTREILPKADAILSRDCIVHFPLDLGRTTLENFKRSNSTYLISTTFPSVQQNRECRLGSWRPLNLTLAPFNLPQPIAILRERAPNPSDPYNDKSQGVWKLSELKL